MHKPQNIANKPVHDNNSDDPVSFEHQISKLEDLINLQRFNEAEQLCTKLIANYPNKPAGYIGLTRVAFRNQDYVLTLKRCEQFMVRFPNQVRFLSFNAESLIKLDRLEEAEQICRILITKHPDKPDGFVGLARIAAKQQDYVLTMERCEEFLPQFPNNFILLSLKAEALLALSFFDELEPLCLELTSNYPNNPKGYLLLARAAYQRGYYEIALERCDEILRLFPKELSASHLLANTLIALFRFEEANNLYQHITLTQPDKPNGFIGIARVAAAQSQHEAVLGLCDKAIELFPDNIEAINLKGNALIALSRFEEAQFLFEKLVCDSPHHINGYVGLHQLFRKLEKHQLALDTIASAYSINPRNISVITKYVAILELMGRTEEAYELLERHVNEQRHITCLVPLINLYSRQGETSKILTLLDTKGRLLTKHADLQFKLGLALRNKGDLNASYTVFQDYLGSDDSISFAVLKNKIKAYEQLWLLHSIIENHKLFKHNLSGSSPLLAKPFFHKETRYNEVIELARSGEFSNSDLLLHQLLSDDPTNIILRFILLITNLAKSIHQLCSHYTESFMDIGESPVLAINLAEKLIYRIQNKIPTSMIRLCDGEGTFLEYPKTFQHWQAADREEYQRIWWGEIKFDQTDLNRMTSVFNEAILNADILGIPDLSRMILFINNLEDTPNSSGYRGLKAIFHHLSAKEYLAIKLPNTIITSCNYHSALEFWSLYRYIFTHVNKVTVITCHPKLEQILQEKFGVPSVNIIAIPSEHRHSHNFNSYSVENNHYPDYFNTILSTINVEPGEVFLVAAGFLGKIYCNEIKNKGGIGIDIGSIADIWMGYNTRFEHQVLHRIWGVHIDLDLLRKKTFSGYVKVENKRFYRSNYYCDSNIYQEGDELKAPYPVQHKTLLITGHPRCGSRYMSLLFTRLGVDINHEWFGKDGICSWLFAVKDLNMPILGGQNIDPSASYFTRFDYTLAYVRDPFEAIPSILVENRGERSYNYRRNHIINELGIDIDDYTSDMERAVASYLFWNKIVQLNNPIITFKVEDCIQSVVDFLLDKKLINEPINITGLDVPTNANSTIAMGFTKPELSPTDYTNIALHLREELLLFCGLYGYNHPDLF